MCFTYRYTVCAHLYMFTYTHVFYIRENIYYMHTCVCSHIHIGVCIFICIHMLDFILKASSTQTPSMSSDIFLYLTMRTHKDTHTCL